MAFAMEIWNHSGYDNARNIESTKKKSFKTPQTAIDNLLVGGFSPTHLKNMHVKLDHFPNYGVKIKKYVQPPPSLGFTHPICSSRCQKKRHTLFTLTLRLFHLSHEKNPGWLVYIGDYTTQLYRDFDKPL